MIDNCMKTLFFFLFRSGSAISGQSDSQGLLQTITSRRLVAAHRGKKYGLQHQSGHTQRKCGRGKKIEKYGLISLIPYCWGRP